MKKRKKTNQRRRLREPRLGRSPPAAVASSVEYFFIFYFFLFFAYKIFLKKILAEIFYLDVYFLFLPFDKFLSVKIFLVKFFLAHQFVSWNFFYPPNFHLKNYLSQKNVWILFSWKTTTKILKIEKNWYRKIDSTGTVRSTVN